MSKERQTDRQTRTSFVLQEGREEGREKKNSTNIGPEIVYAFELYLDCLHIGNHQAVHSARRSKRSTVLVQEL